MRISSRKGNHGIENFRFSFSRFSNGIGVVGYLPFLYITLKELNHYYLLVEKIFGDIADENIIGFLSAISITEFVTKPLADGKVTDVERFKQFLSSLSIQALAVTYEVAERAGKTSFTISKYPNP